jgi:hypothetical protein
MQMREPFDVGGVEIKRRLDFGARAVEWRGLCKTPGRVSRAISSHLIPDAWAVATRRRRRIREDPATKNGIRPAATRTLIAPHRASAEGDPARGARNPIRTMRAARYAPDPRVLRRRVWPGAVLTRADARRFGG